MLGSCYRCNPTSLRYCLLLTGIVIPKPEGFAQPLLLRFLSRSKSQKICCAVRAGALCASLLLDCYLTSELLCASLALIFLKQSADIHPLISSGPSKNAVPKHIDDFQVSSWTCTHHSAMCHMRVQLFGKFHAIPRRTFSALSLPPTQSST
jgi:hypothetical protein